MEIKIRPAQQPTKPTHEPVSVEKTSPITIIICTIFICLCFGAVVGILSWLIRLVF